MIYFIIKHPQNVCDLNLVSLLCVRRHSSLKINYYRYFLLNIYCFNIVIFFKNTNKWLICYIYCFHPFNNQKLFNEGTSLAVQWLRLRAFPARGVGSIPSRGTKSLHAVWPKGEKNPRTTLMRTYSVSSYPV